jgi:hypothetical protein
MHRRMEDRIRDLCEQAVGETDSAKLRGILLELRDALHRHIGHIRTKLSAYPVAVERRGRPYNGDPKNSRNNPH